MARSGRSRLIVALLVAGLASTLVAAPPAASPPTCGCCASGLCLLAAGGCDHRQPAAPGRLASCCIKASKSGGAVSGQDLPRLESAVLPLPCLAARPTLASWRWRPVSAAPAAHEPAPERPPPRFLR